MLFPDVWLAEVWLAEQDQLALEKLPPVTKASQAAAVQLLKDVGFSDGEIFNGWCGSEKFSLRDHRMQLLIGRAMTTNAKLS
jgi:hypothetical protein